MENTVRITAIAEHYDVTTKTIRNWIKRGLPYMKAGNVLRFDLEEVVNWTKKTYTAGRNKG